MLQQKGLNLSQFTSGALLTPISEISTDCIRCVYDKNGTKNCDYIEPDYELKIDDAAPVVAPESTSASSARALAPAAGTAPDVNGKPDTEPEPSSSSSPSARALAPAAGETQSTLNAPDTTALPAQPLAPDL